MNLIDYEDKYGTLRVLIYGLPNSGKSTLAATLAEKYNLIWIDLENSLDTLTKLPYEIKKNIQVFKIPDTASLPVAAHTIQYLFKDKLATLCVEHGIIDCPECKKLKAAFDTIDLRNLDPKKDVVVLDGLTQLGYSFLMHQTKKLDIDDKPERDHWGALRKQTEYFASNIQNVPFNLVVTALTSETTLDNGQTRLVPSFGSKDMGANMPAKFSTLVYTDVISKKHKAYSSSTASNSFMSRSRAGFRIEDLPEPNLCPMFDSYLAQHTGGTEKLTPAPPPVAAGKTPDRSTSILNNLKRKL